MSNVLNRITKEYKLSVNTPDYSDIDWIINPDISLVEGSPVTDWVIDGDTVRLINAAEKLTRLPLIKDKKKEELITAANNYGRKFFEVDAEFRLKRLYDDAIQNGLTNRSAYIAQALIFEVDVQTDLITRLGIMAAAIDEDAVKVISDDFSNTIAPDVTVIGALGVSD